MSYRAKALEKKVAMERRVKETDQMLDKLRSILRQKTNEISTSPWLT